MIYSRRALLAGISSGTAQLLFSRMLFSGVFGLPDTHRQGSAPAGQLLLKLTAVTDGILRISISPANDAPREQELGVVDRVWAAPLEQPGTVHEHAVKWGKYTLHIQDCPLCITASLEGKFRQQIQFDTDSTDVRFKLDGPVFGLGEGVRPYDRRGTRDPMVNGENNPNLKVLGARMPIPWVISPMGWGVFVGQPSGDFEFTQTEARFRGNEATSTRNVFLLLGDTPADVLREYANLTGYPHMPPLWSLGYQQSHRTLANEEEILVEAKTFRQKKLPCDAMIFLGTGFCPSGWNSGHGSFTFNEAVFPDPPATLKKLHDENMKVILHVVPPGDLHGTISDTGAAAEQQDDAVAYWAKHEAIAKAGVDGWWPDEGDRLSVYVRLQRNQMYWEGSRRFAPTKRPFALHRNGYAGMQRFGWLWSGDTFSTWEALRAQIMVGINIGLCGIPFWGSDTGGFVPTPEYTPELWIRWFQFSAFCPSFRSHGRAWKLHLPWGWNTGAAGPKEVEEAWIASWPKEEDLHRPEIEKICQKYLNLRYEMLPYVYSTVAQSHRTGLPMIRALWIAYPNDTKALTIDDAYLWGDYLLVAPVYEKGVSSRMVYLPGGIWWNYWSGERLSGGLEISVPAALDTIPLFVRAGAILPTGPVRQFTGERNDELTTLQVFPGTDGSYRWYDDDGDGFEFENGRCMNLLCTWINNNRTLTLMLDQGSLGVGRKIRVVASDKREVKEVTLTEKPFRIVL